MPGGARKMSPIPLSSPDITQAEVDAVVAVLRAPMPTLSNGPLVEAFERRCAEVAGRRFGVGVSSGNAGLHLAMIAAGVGPGDEVITTPFGSVASANCILFAGARPAFVDIDPRTLNVDVAKVEAAITPRTRAILAVEAFGHPGGMPELERLAQRHELPLIEDCCDGFGGAIGVEPASGTPRPRKIGSFGRIGVFGFHSANQVTTGEGGMLVTDDDRIAALCRSLRDHGRDARTAGPAHARLGYNYRMSELAAALGLAQAARLEEILDARRRVANAYVRRLMAHPHLILPTIDDRTQMSWCAFVVRLNDQFEVADRDAIVRELDGRGVGASGYFAPIHLQPHLAEQFGHRAGDYPVCEHVSARTIALPFFNRLTDQQVDVACAALTQAIDGQLILRRMR